MAKRDIPEINAGSMADIAFLLLIFFLVTTTMDRDKAYPRNIPKKIEIPPEDIEPFQPRDILVLRTNQQNQLMMVGGAFPDGQIMNNPDEISVRIVEWYRYNEEATAGVLNNYPQYSRITVSTINDQIRQVEAELDEVEDGDDTDEGRELIKFVESKLTEWKKKKTALAQLGRKVLPEISPRSHIRIETQKLTEYELFAKIHSEIQEAIYELRNDASKRIFGHSYSQVISKLADKPGDKEYQQKKSLLEILYPARIIEVTPK